MRTRPASMLALLPLLAACGSNGFAPACPRAAILADGGDVAHYRNGSHDLTDLESSGRILGIIGQCQRGEQPGIVTASVAARMRFTRGPAAPGRTLSVPYFIAVTEGERVLTRKAFTQTVTFAPNTDTVTLTTEDLPVDLPVSDTKSAAAYSILVSFQLSPDELRENRRAR